MTIAAVFLALTAGMCGIASTLAGTIYGGADDSRFWKWSGWSCAFLASALGLYAEFFR